MKFSEYCEMRDFSEGKLKSGLFAGIAAAGLLSPLAMAATDRPVEVEAKETDRTRAMYERLKDKNRYYSVPTAAKLSRMAYDGDEWAIREIAWPEEHKFHKKGRPFFRNTGPHPDGLKFYSGLGDD